MKIKENHTLRPPTGPHTPGFAHHAYTYTRDGNERTLSCLVFYPAAGESGERKPYIHPGLMPGSEGIRTNSWTGAPIVPGKHPLLVFSHGYGAFCEANTVQMEELASHGYIVLSVSHPGEGGYTLPDGTIQAPDVEFITPFQQENLAGMGNHTAYIQWLKENAMTASMEENLTAFKGAVAGVSVAFERCQLWIDDNRAALDSFLALTADSASAFYGSADEDKIAAFGMSFGGAAAMGMTYSDPRIKAAVNLDGFFYHKDAARPVSVPMMLLQNGNALTGEHLLYPYLAAAGPVYHIVVEGSTHGNFTDYSELLAENFIQSVPIDGVMTDIPTLGTVDCDEMERLMNLYLVEFFDKTLRGKPALALDGANPQKGVRLQSRNI